MKLSSLFLSRVCFNGVNFWGEYSPEYIISVTLTHSFSWPDFERQHFLKTMWCFFKKKIFFSNYNLYFQTNDKTDKSRVADWGCRPHHIAALPFPQGSFLKLWAFRDDSLDTFVVTRKHMGFWVSCNWVQISAEPLTSYGMIS